MTKCFKILFPIIWGCIIFCSSCGSSNSCPSLAEPFTSAEFESIPKDAFDEYAKVSLGFITNSAKPSEEVNIYIDRSSGINEAFGAGNSSKDVAQKLVDKFVNAPSLTTNVFDVKESISVNTSNPHELVSFVGNAENFNNEQLIADQRIAFDEMAKKNDLSFLISDCELYNKGVGIEKVESWARPSFASWLKKGNKIDIWACNYATKSGGKYMYFIAFVPEKMGANVARNYIALKTEMSSINNTHTFNLSNKSWEISPDKSLSQQSPGLNSNLLNKDVFNEKSFFRNLSNGASGYEFLEINMPLKAVKQQISPKGIVENFYSKLLIDLSEDVFFRINNIDLKVYVINEDFKKFIRFYQIQKNGPKYIQDENTKAKILDPANCYSQYYDANGAIKSEFVYRPDLAKQEVKEIFKFNKELFNNTKSKPREAELGIDLHENFNPENKSIDVKDPYVLLRVDFIIPPGGSSFNSPDLQYFKWSLAKIENKAFQNSIDNLIRTDIEPSNKTIHTIFIKLIND